MLDFSLLCLNCDNFVIEAIALTFQQGINHDVEIDFFFYHQCKAIDLSNALDKISEDKKLEYVSCHFPLESYIGNILRDKYKKTNRSQRKITIAQDYSHLPLDLMDEAINRLSFQYLDTRVVFSDARYKTRFETAIKPMSESTKFDQKLIESTALAYRTAWYYYRGRSGNVGIWTY